MQYKILSIDGGGVKGLIAAEIIKAIESKDQVLLRNLIVLLVVVVDL